MKDDNRDLYFADEVGRKESVTFDKFKSKCESKVSEETIKCELQLAMLGDWERLEFNIDYKKFIEDEKNLKQWYRPFQPKKGILNDRESILLYGLKGDKPIEPTGLSQIFAKLGYVPNESEFKFPTEAKEKLTCCKEVFDWFGDWGRCFLIKLNAGGFYPRHRDHYLLHRDTIRLIAFIGNASDKLEWELDGRIRQFQPNSLYYVNTAKLHRLSAWQHNCNMVVFNLPKTWDSITKLLYKVIS